MNRFLFIFLFICSCTGSSNKGEESVVQNTQDSLIDNSMVSYLALSKSLLESDSIIVASHESTSYPVDDLKTGKTLPPPELITNGIPNATIIHEQKKLGKKQIKLLDSILTVSAIEDSVASLCFQPRHAVFIYKKNQLSFIDFCFDCHSYSVSPDIKERIILDDTKWKNLFQFFKDMGLKYELDY